MNIDQRERLLRLLEKMVDQYEDFPAANLIIGALGLAVTNHLEVELAQIAWAWVDSRFDENAELREVQL